MNNSKLNPHEEENHFSSFIASATDIERNPTLEASFHIQEKIHPKLPSPVLVYEGKHVNPTLTYADFELVLFTSKKGHKLYRIYSSKYYILVPSKTAQLVSGKIATLQIADLRECGVTVETKPHFIYDGGFLPKDHRWYNGLFKMLVNKKVGKIKRNTTKHTTKRTTNSVSNSRQSQPD